MVSLLGTSDSERYLWNAKVTVKPRLFHLLQCTYINGAPQNTFVPGAIDLAEKKKVFIAGDDFKSGQTKVKSVLVDFLVTAGIKPVSIVSYNHLGNNDGYNCLPLNSSDQKR